MDKKPIQIWLTQEQRDAIDRAAEKMGLTVAGYVRMATLNHAAALGFHAEVKE